MLFGLMGMTRNKMKTKHKKNIFVDNKLIYYISILLIIVFVLIMFSGFIIRGIEKYNEIHNNTTQQPRVVYHMEDNKTLIMWDNGSIYLKFGNGKQKR